MKTLSTEFRRQLERTVIEARDIAEVGACVALEALAVQHHEPYGHMGSEERTLRRRFRAHARQLGDRPDSNSGGHGIDHLVHECAYEHWHGMLFGRFLAENHLLIEPEMGVAITLDECEALADEDGVDKWVLAARFAHCMLPQVFRPDHLVFEMQFAREHRLKLEGLIESLPPDVFTATDSLGWVYQFWQAKKKETVNRSEVKIGADELPAVTQLFTEPYMVQFLLHNSLGAWWVSRFPDRERPVELNYLRLTEDDVPDAGGFESWPDDLSEFRLLDPCCGSGHFLVAAFLMLVPMRMALERLGATEAIDKVLRENLHGLELDHRCVTIAAFALALEAWRYPADGRFRPLPKLNLAWCGQPVAGKREQWLALAEGDSRLEAGMAELYDTFRDAPTLGSLIDPTHSVSEDMLTAGFADLQPLLEKALLEHAGEEEWEETAIAARGLADAAKLLSLGYELVITNVPYLSRKRQGKRILAFADQQYPTAKRDLATIFLERCIQLCNRKRAGVVQIVMPQNWLFLSGYMAQRERLLRENIWRLVVRLGSGAFETISGEIVNVILLTLGSEKARSDSKMYGIDVSGSLGPEQKARSLQTGQVMEKIQKDQLKNPDCRISFGESETGDFLNNVAECYQGIVTGDIQRFVRKTWEVVSTDGRWVPFRRTNNTDSIYGDVSEVLLWEYGAGSLHSYAKQTRDQLNDMHESGNRAWGKRGVAINRMGVLRAAPYYGEHFDNNVAAVFPKASNELVPAIYAFLSSDGFSEIVRELDASIKVTNQTLLKVPFDVQRWKEVATETLPTGLPTPYSDDPTQWVFHGHCCSSSSPLQVAVGRLLGYRWPAESGREIELSEKCRYWVEKVASLNSFADQDGVVCLAPVRSERPAHERLLQILKAAWGDDWRDDILAKLLAEIRSANLDDWLRDQFFDEHCKLFHHRPFIWHIWDGRKRDGFHALINYHKLAEGDGKGRRLLESLIYSYLGDWIIRQQDDVKRGEGGAEDRLAAALELQKRLVAILEGEPPFDLFVRWKPIEELPIGWEPDINDGVRLNIRPFMAQDIPSGKKGAGILRAKPNVHWKKDRGKDPVRDQAQFPWFWENGKFTGERINDVYLTIAEKRAARERAREKR